MKTIALICAALAFAAPAAVAATSAPQAKASPAAKPMPATYAGHELAGQAKVSLAAARAAALKARPGKVVDQELEKESGGSGLRYSFDVKNHGKTYEVGIDAVSGKVLENGAETRAEEAADAKTEAKAKAAHPHS